MKYIKTYKDGSAGYFIGGSMICTIDINSKLLKNNETPKEYIERVFDMTEIIEKWIVPLPESSALYKILGKRFMYFPINQKDNAEQELKYLKKYESEEYKEKKVFKAGCKWYCGRWNIL